MAIRVNTVNLCKGFIVANPDLADNELELVYNIWIYEGKKHKPVIDVAKLSVKDLLKHLRDKKLSSWENITRSRRKCQELYPDTRGKLYEARHRHQETIKKDVKRQS
tara:strand:- start:6598 stop:6918 length:321 start_codon:yes stop_codon:yes gene_type:complete